MLAALLLLLVLLMAGRLALPTYLRWYVNDAIAQSPLYEGRIGDIDVHLWRGGYSIEDVRLIKTTGVVPVPLFAARRVDLAIQWNALRHGKLVGGIHFDQPVINFVDSEDESEDQTGAGGPWLTIIRDLFPLRINRATIEDGAVHFRAFDRDPPVDLYITEVYASIENLTNIHDETMPLIATVNAQGLALDHAKVEYQMKLDPFSYRPTFQLAVKLLGLDVTRTNDLTLAYAGFDFERGWFDLVIEMDAKEGMVEGYVKPMYRNLRVLSMADVEEDDALRVFWEALVGVATEVFENQPRDQFATNIAFRGDLTAPEINLLEIIGNVLHNAFVRAYMPTFHGTATEISPLEFDPGSIINGGAASDVP